METRLTAGESYLFLWLPIDFQQRSFNIAEGDNFNGHVMSNYRFRVDSLSDGFSRNSSRWFSQPTFTGGSLVWPFS
jgi:hypothetical protein